MRNWLVGAVVFGAVQLAAGQGVLIPSSVHKDHVFDSTGSTLYFTTSLGSLQRYNVGSGALMTPFSVGTSLNAIDITPNGANAFITDLTTSGGQGFVRQVNLSSGQVTTLPYTQAFGESYSWDVVMVSNDRGYVTTEYSGSGWTPMRQINVSAGTLTTRQEVSSVRQRTALHRGGDRSRMLFTESNISSGPVWNYTTATDTFTHVADTQAFMDSVAGSVNRDGSLQALGFGGTRIYNSLFGLVTTLPASAGFVFDPTRDLLYLVNPTTDQIVAYRTTDWGIETSFAVGENMTGFSRFGQGMMSISDNGQRLALSTPSGIRVYSVPAPGAGSLVALAAIACVRRRRRAR